MKNQIINCGIETMRIRRYSLAFYVGPGLDTHIHIVKFYPTIYNFFFIYSFGETIIIVIIQTKQNNNNKKLTFPHLTTYLL